MVQALREHCGINLNDATLHATELRVASVRAALEGKVHTAVDLLTQVSKEGRGLEAAAAAGMVCFAKNVF